MRFGSAFTRLRPLLDLIFPPRCVYCGQLGSYLCEKCLAEAEPIGRDVCIRCGNPLTVRGICHRCQQDPPDPLRAIRGVYFYNGPIAQGIRSLKYHGVQPLAAILAVPLATYLQEHPVDIDILAPVPLHPEKEVARGFNQSELLAASVSEATNIPLRTDLVRRVVDTQPQARLTRRQRLQNVANAFAPGDGVRLHGESILLIDDVATTGATLRACARALKTAGAGDIWALTVARANYNTLLESSKPPLSPTEAFLVWDAERKAPIADSGNPII